MEAWLFIVIILVIVIMALVPDILKLFRGK